MDKKLMCNAAVKFIGGLALTGVLLFIPAGTFQYWNAWLFIVLLFVPMLFFGVVLCARAPELLKKRLNTNEKEAEQKTVVLLSGLSFVVAFVVAGLDFRYGWSHLPLWLVVAASVLMLASYGLYMEVVRENAYLSRTVEVQENQRVVDTGLYGIVRHPMYAATVLLYMAIPIVLGSAFAWLIFLTYPALIAKRIKNEEAVLEQGLAGYTEYKAKVRYRLIPFVW